MTTSFRRRRALRFLTAVYTTHFSLMLRLYVYGELGIKQRYPERLRNNIQRLDSAFAAVFHPSGKTADKYVETIKRTRLKMMERLRTDEVH